MLLLFFLVKIAGAQTPSYYTGNTNSPSNSFPFNNAAGKSMQSLIAPAEFIGGASGAYFGNIVKFYVQGTANVTPTFSALTVKMGQTTAVTLPTGALYAGPLTTVYNSTTPVSFTSTASGWLMITLQTPFLYDPSKSLVVEISQCGSSGGSFTVTNVSKTGSIRRTWNASSCTPAYSGQGAELFNCGIDLISAGNNDIGVSAITGPGQFCSPGSLPVVATLQNFGMNQVTSATIDWSVNNVLQTPYSFTGTLDTIGGAGSTSASITLGNYTFPSTNVTIKAWSSAPNSATDTIALNDTAQATKGPSMMGNYTINPSGAGATNFTSFAAAIAAMNLNGLCGPINFTVAPGNYNNQVIIGDIVGASNVNSITFDGMNPDSCRIYGAYASQGVVIMNATKYITFKNFKVENTAAGACAGIAIVGSVRTVQIYNNRVFVPIQVGTSSSGYGIIATGSANGSGLSAMSGDSIIIDSNIVTGGAYGINAYGASNANANRGYVFQDNKVYNCNYRGGYIAYNYSAIKMLNNEFNVNGQNYGYYGLYFYSNQNPNTTIPHEIIGNKINNFTYYGIYMYLPQSTSAAAPTRFFNNVLQGIVSGYTLSQYGIYLQLPASAIAYFYHNTVVLNNSSASTSATCFYHSGSANLVVKNNVFYFTGGTGVPFYTATTITGNKINYNNYFNSLNTAAAPLVYNGGTWNASTYRTNARGGDSSYNVNPAFASRTPVPGNLALTDGCDGYGVDLTSLIPTDIVGTTRSVTPNPGAYEYVGGANNNLKVVSLYAPSIPITAGTQDLRFLVKNIGANVVTSYNATYKVNSVSPVTISMTNSVGVCATDTATFTGANQITIGATNHITCYTSAPNASTDPEPVNDTIRTSLFTPLNGTYTVGGTNPDFATPQAAALALQYGVAGPVTFDIRQGTYLGQVIVNGPVLGISSTNRVTFEGNDRTNRTISANVTGSAFLINGVSYITVQNLKIINTMAGNVCGVGVIGTNTNSNASNVHIRKCDVQVPTQSGTSESGYGINFTATAGGTGVSAMRADSSIIDSNIVTGGGYGIVHYGATNAAYNRGVRIRGNEVRMANYMGGYIAYNYNPMEILNNSFNVQGQNYGYYGCNFYSNQSSNATIPHLFNGNSISNFSYYGVYMYLPMATSAADTMQVYNNTLNSAPNGYTLSQYGFYVSLPASAKANFYHNTVVINTGNTSTSSTGFYSTGSANILLKNNVFAYYAGSGVPIYLATAVTGNRVNYNNYYHGNPSGNLVYNGGTWNATNYLTTARGGDSSFNYNPIFVSRLPMPGNLHLTSACDQRGVDLTADVTYDRDGEIRNVPPQIGSDENASGAIDMAADVLLAPSFPVDSGYQDVAVRVRNNGSTTITSFNLGYKLNNGSVVTQGWSGSLAPCDTTSLYFTGLQQVYIPYNVTNVLKVFTSAPNASTDLNPTNDTLTTTVSTPLNGNYIIGTVAPSDYPSFTAAAASLQMRGVGGPVVFNVRTGTYNESFNLTAATGSSLTNTITFKSMANHVDSVVIFPNNGDPQIMRLEGAKNTIFRNITFKSTSVASTQNGIVLTGSISNDTIIDCKIDMIFQTSYGNYSVYGTGLGSDFDGFVLKNNKIMGSYYGIYVYGQGNTYAGRYRNLVIDNNHMDNSYAYSIYTYYSSNFTFNKNLVTPNAGYSGNINNFMYSDSVNITNNTWNFTNNATMYLGYYSIGSNGRRCLVNNNVITGITNMTAPSIYLGYYSQYIDFMHNSFSVPSTSQCAYIYNSGAVSMRIKNNIFHNRGTGSAAYVAAAATNVESNYNNLFTAGSILINGVTSQTSIAGWRNYSNQDKQSWSYNPGFTSFTNLVPDATNPNSWSVNGRAEYQASVPTDITGAARISNMANGVSDVGAYEFTPTSTPPLATAVPSTPVAGGTQSFLFGGDTIARVTYDAFATAPSSLGMRIYSGVAPANIAPATAYPYFYVSAEAPSGSYTYTLALKYKPIWMGTLPTPADLRIAAKAPANAWLVLGGTNSVVDTLAYTITSASTLSDLPSVFTMADDLNPLPVSLMRFNGSKADLAANLNWATASERNSSRFEVERSYDANTFAPIGNVKSNGNSNRLQNYSFVDADAFVNNEPVVYYRLKMIDNDGSFEYSNTISINNNEEETTIETVNVFPNPFNNELFIEYKSVQNETVELRDLSGRLVMTQVLNSSNAVHQLNIPSSLDKGIYILTFGSNKSKSLKVIRD